MLKRKGKMGMGVRLTHATISMPLTPTIPSYVINFILHDRLGLCTGIACIERLIDDVDEQSCSNDTCRNLRLVERAEGRVYSSKLPVAK